MQLHWGWAVLGALALGAGLIWWMQPGGESRSPPDSPGRHDSGRETRSKTDAVPTIYRWVDARGVVNISNEHPPAGRKFTIVHVNPNQNIVPMSGNGSASKADTAAH